MANNQFLNKKKTFLGFRWEKKFMRKLPVNKIFAVNYQIFSSKINRKYVCITPSPLRFMWLLYRLMLQLHQSFLFKII